MSLLAKKDAADEYGIWISKREDYIDQSSSRSIKRKTYRVPLPIEGQDRSLSLPRKSTTANSVVESTSRRHCYEKMKREDSRDDEYRRRADGDSWQISPSLIWYVQLRSPSLKDE